LKLNTLQKAIRAGRIRMGRFGYLTLRHGKWKDRQLISNRWVGWALTPTPAEPTYGFMNWFLNTDRKLMPSAPASVFVHDRRW
jgi:hypothetical protein